MNKTLVFLFLIFNSFCFAAYEKVKIGNIDPYYNDVLDYEELRNIIDDIEYVFESQLDVNVFDYSEDGKPIDIMFVPASKLEQRIEKKIIRLEKKRAKLEKLNDYFYIQRNEIDDYQYDINTKTNQINEKTRELNAYIQEINEKKAISSSRYAQVKSYVKDKKDEINENIKELRTLERKAKKVLRDFNNKVRSYNSQTREYNRLSKEIESMTRSFRKVKGRAFGIKEITLKTYIKNGKRVEEKTEKNSMTKIEIYGFSSLPELKAILAHELGHLVGVPHISNKNALMNPIIQKNQVEDLELTLDDIRAFEDHF